MVDIAFSPPLKALSEVRPNITGDRTITTRFVATLSAIEWRRLKQQGAVIELWTNLPIEGNEGGNWSGVAFEEDKAAQVQEGMVQLSSVLHLQYLIYNTTLSKYSYTYRINYHGAHLQWLGTHASNGTVIVKSEAYWSLGVDPESSTLGFICGDAKWRAWGLTPNEPLQLSTLKGNVESTPPVQTLLLVPEGPCMLSRGLPLLFSSNDKNVTVSNGLVRCDTPKKVKVHCGSEMPSIVQILRDAGIQVVQPTIEDCFLVSTFSTNSDGASFSLTPVCLSSHIPAKLRIKASEVQNLLPTDESFVVYLPGEGGSQSILPTDGEYEIPLIPGLDALCIVRMQTFLGSQDQSIGIATPASIHHPNSLPSSSPISSPTTTNTSIASSTASTDSYPKGAAVKISRPSRILVDKTIPLPLVLVRQIDRIMRIRLLHAFYRLALYVLSLITPFFGIAFSLRWAMNNGKRQEEILPKVPSEVTTTKTATTETQVSTTEVNQNTVHFEVVPTNGRVTVAFRGDAVDDVGFSFDGKDVDNVIATWQGDELHQFVLQVEDHRGILTAFINPPSNE